MTRADIERRADPKDRMMLQSFSAEGVFKYAFERGWLTVAEYNLAREHYGRLWNYCGD